MPLPRPASPRVLLADLRAFAAERSRHQWVAAAMAIVMPIAIIITFLIDGRTNIVPKREIYFVDSWSAARTDAEIIADQKRDQAKREALMKQRQREWQKIDRKLERLGI